MKLYIKNLAKKNPLKNQQIKSLIKRILKHENLKKCQLSLVFVSDKEIQSLNQKFLRRNNPTDVLAFDLRDKKDKEKRRQINGEIIISLVTARRNAKIYKTALTQEIKLYIIHGILHLLGYNDNRDRQIGLMRKKEEELLEILG